MKDFMYNKNGAIYVSVIFISLIIVVLSTSLLNILTSNNMAINSNNDNYRAGYIIESVLELKIEEIMKLCDQAINDYLTDLQTYNMGCVETAEGYILHNPPSFHDYIVNLAFDIEGLSGSANNLFEEYKEKHYYKVDIECNLNKNCVNITSRGEYKRARKFINVELELPTITNEGDDEYGLPKIAVSPAKVIRYYQTLGL